MLGKQLLRAGALCPRAEADDPADRGDERKATFPRAEPPGERREKERATNVGRRNEGRRRRTNERRGQGTSHVIRSRLHVTRPPPKEEERGEGESSLRRRENSWNAAAPTTYVHSPAKPPSSGASKNARTMGEEEKKAGKDSRESENEGRNKDARKKRHTQSRAHGEQEKRNESPMCLRERTELQLRYFPATPPSSLRWRRTRDTFMFSVGSIARRHSFARLAHPLSTPARRRERILHPPHVFYVP